MSKFLTKININRSKIMIKTQGILKRYKIRYIYYKNRIRIYRKNCLKVINNKSNNKQILNLIKWMIQRMI